MGFWDSIVSSFNSFNPSTWDDDEEEQKIREQQSLEALPAKFIDNTVGYPKHGLDLLEGYLTDTAKVGPEGEVTTPTIGDLVGPAFVPPPSEEKSLPAKALEFINPLPAAAMKVPEIRQAGSKLASKGIDFAADPSVAFMGAGGPAISAGLGAYFAGKGAQVGGESIGTGIAQAFDQDNPVEGTGNIAGGLFDLGMAGYGSKHLAEGGAELARNTGIPDFNLTMTQERNLAPIEPYEVRMNKNNEKMLEGSEFLREMSKNEFKRQVPEKLEGVTGWKEFPDPSGGTWNVLYENGQRKAGFLKTEKNGLGTVVKDESVTRGKTSKYEMEDPVAQTYSKIGEMADKGQMQPLDENALTPGSISARRRYSPNDEAMSLAVTAAKVNPERLAVESTFLPGTEKAGQTLDVADVSKGIRDIAADGGKEFSPEAQAIRHNMDMNYEGQHERFMQDYGTTPEPLENHKVNLDTGDIVSGKEALPDLPVLPFLKSAAEGILPSGLPSSQRGAAGDIGPLNKFEDSQYRKYGPEWKTKQSPEENAFHQKLLGGGEGFQNLPVNARGPETDLPLKVDRTINRPDGTKLRIETTDDGGVRTTKMRNDGSILEVKEGPDFDNMKESIEVFDPSEETPLSTIRDKAKARDIAFKNETKLREKLMNAQNAEEARTISKELKKNLQTQIDVQDPSKPTEADSFTQGWDKLDRGEKALEGLNIIRSIKSSLDTPILRQGRVVTFNNPKLAAQAARRMGKVAFSKEQFDLLHKEIANDPVYSKFAELGKEFVPDIPGVSGKREEAFPSPLAEKIPVVGKAVVAPSDRAYTGFMNAIRLGHWKKNVARLEKRGLSVEKDPEVFRDLARVTNLVTFRADTRNKVVKRIAESNIAGNIFYSPRNKMSQIQILKNMLPFGSNLSGKGGLASPKNLLRKQIAQTWAINAAIYGTLAYAGLGTIEKDPESSDFLKFKVGNKRFNPWLGTNQLIRAAVLLASGRQKSLSGRERSIAPEEVAGREIRKSLAPGPGLLWDLYSGKNVVGEKVRQKEDSLEKQIFDSSLYALKNGLTPMSVDDIIKEYKQSGLASSIGTVLIPGLAGENVSVYEPSKPKKKTKKSSGNYEFSF